MVFSSIGNGGYRNGTCIVPLLQLVLLINIDLLPHLQSFMCKLNFNSFVAKLYCTICVIGCYSIRKLPFPNGGYSNGFAEHLGIRLSALKINSTYCACYYCGKFGQSDSRGGIYDTQVDEYITQVQ